MEKKCLVDHMNNECLQCRSRFSLDQPPLCMHTYAQHCRFVLVMERFFISNFLRASLSAWIMIHSLCKKEFETFGSSCSDNWLFAWLWRANAQDERKLSLQCPLLFISFHLNIFIVYVSVFSFTNSFARWTSTLGTAINGIWGRYADTNDVNTVDAIGELGK